MIKIAIDCHGGDNSPEANVLGVFPALDKHDDLCAVLLGDEDRIGPLLGKRGEDELKRGRIEIIHAPEVITGEEKPTEAIRNKRDSSMIRGIELLREDESVAALVSTGSTGSLVAAATLRIGRIKGIRRPAFCPVLPTMHGGVVGICDSGANVDITPEQLLQFAIMGSRYLEAAFDVASPRVALLNIGTESEKGDALRKAAYPLLSEAKGISFVGNMESRDLLSGRYDLVVCDGFSGNVLIKSTEGTALEIMKKLKNDISARKLYKLGAVFMKKMFARQKEFFNYHNYGGSVLLGAEKIVVKGHGSSDAAAVAVCIEQAYRIKNAGMNARIAETLNGEEN